MLSYRATGQQCPDFGEPARSARATNLYLAIHVGEYSPRRDTIRNRSFLYEPDLELLISADALWAKRIGVVFPEIVGEPGFDDVRRTLELLAGLRVRWVIPGHGAPFSDFEPAIARAFGRLEGLAADPAKHGPPRGESADEVPPARGPVLFDR
jgi:hypothetical protein